MVNITVYPTRAVTGDVGRIIAYEGQEFSETICVTHPLFPGSEYFVEYKYNNTIHRTKLDGNNQVQLEVRNSGSVPCQFVAIDIQTGMITFKSNIWNFIIQQEIATEASHYPCSSPRHYIHHHEHGHNCNCYNPNPCNCSGNSEFNPYKAYSELLAELRNEEDIRNQLSNTLWEAINKIQGQINSSSGEYVVNDADKLIQEGTYYVSAGSYNFPSTEDSYEVKVSIAKDGNVFQIAYEADSDNVWFRTGILDSSTGRIKNATQWTPYITRVQEL